ncbi:MAG: hypothetical protein CK552_03315 [Actinobacteria bacterium]|nr:MAG: hypothetical protein CK552_03315 [Actinomycetota bacterium]
MFTLSTSVFASTSRENLISYDRNVVPTPGPGVDWSGCDLSGTHLLDADLSRSTWIFTNFNSANLTRTNFNHSNLTIAYLSSLFL